MYDEIEKPKHYNSSKAECEKCGSQIEPIWITRHLISALGNAIKYIWRVDDKGNPIKDLKKAVFYLNDEIKRREKINEQ
jgi:hypothetical protein